VTRTRPARVASRAYLLVQRAAARDVRSQYAEDMRATFDAMADEAAARGIAPVVALLLRESLDLMKARHMASTPIVPAPRRGPAALLGDAWRALRVRQATRALLRRPGFTVTAVLALAAGTAATTTVFTLVDTVVIKPLPYPDADRLAAVMEASPATRERISLVAPIRIDDWQRMSRTFVAISGSYTEALTDTSGQAPERLDGRRVGPRYFTVFGTDPIAGRTFTAAEEQFGGPGAAVISEGFWARRFARASSAIGQALVFGGRGYTIVGVMPATFGASIDTWLPAQFAPGMLQIRDARFLVGVGRLKPGVTVAAAHDDLDRIQRELAAMYPKTDAGWSAQVWDLKSYRIGEQSGLWLVFGAVGLLWLIAMTNVAGLVLVETNRRARELAIRLAIGASRAHVVGVVVQEVLLLAIAGAAVGVLGASWLVALAKSTLATLPRLAELGLDWRATLFAAATGVVAAVLCGLIPALAATRRRPASLVASGGRVVRGGAHRWQRGLVAAQVALSLLLSASATLLLRSYYNLTHVDSGFSTDGVITFHVGARWDEDRGRVGQLQVAILDAVRRMPGVEDAGLVSFLPESNATLRYRVKIAGLAGPDGTGTLQSGERTISVGYLRALQVRLLAGEWCPALKPNLDAPRYAMVNREFAGRFGAGMNIAGHEMRYVEVQGPADTALTITGVIDDLAEDGANAARTPYVYACEPGGTWPDPNYVIRTADPGTFIANLAPVIRQIDPTRAVFAVRPLEAIEHDAVESPRLNAAMVGAFATGALLLAAVGLYGLFTLIVSESRREIGVRLALGARPGQVVRMILLDASRLLAIGVTVGLVLAVAAHGVLAGVLFQVAPLDPATFALAIVTLAAVAVAAVSLPALRASRVAPTEALAAD
jgi:putative ABC transport system permease protein